jgi:tryptophan-rich sensory protein
MPTSLNQSLVVNIAGAVGLAVALNGLVFALGWDKAAPPAATDLPGWVVGTVWLFLFAGMGAARSLVATGCDESGGSTAILVSALILLCAAYPFYALLSGSRVIGLIGNVVTVGATLYVVWRLWPVSRSAAMLVFPIVPWIIFASWTILRALNVMR